MLVSILMLTHCGACIKIWSGGKSSFKSYGILSCVLKQWLSLWCLVGMLLVSTFQWQMWEPCWISFLSSLDLCNPDSFCTHWIIIFKNGSLHLKGGKLFWIYGDLPACVAAFDTLAHWMQYWALWTIWKARSIVMFHQPSFNTYTFPC